VTPRTKKSASASLKPTPTVLPEKPAEKISLGGTPRFVRCQMLGPDGKTRSGWEMWLGEHCFGRADQKALLLKSLERQQQPPQSFHWREVHRQRFERIRGPKEPEIDENNEADEEAG
jgi:hypothetical protein